MKTALMVMVAAVMALFAAESSAKPSPAHENAKVNLPDQASDQAHTNRAAKQLDIVPPVLPPAPPILPPAVVALLSGSSTASTQAAQAAISDATISIRTRVAQSTSISVITITATRLVKRVTPFPPVGRAGDLEILKFRFNDRHGVRIGFGNLLCRWASIARRLCWGEARLPRGSLVALGSSQSRVAGEFAIIGGTGVYSFKQGFMTFSPLSLNKFAVRILLA